MKKLTLLLLAILTFGCSDEDISLNQGPDIEAKGIVDDQLNAVAGEDILAVVEEQATFPGGMAAWAKHLQKTIKYPEQAKKEGIEGNVSLSFIVHEDGRIDNVQVARGIGGGCDEQAVNALLESPNWVPGKQGGKTVKTKMQIRVAFKLNAKRKSEPAKKVEG